MSTDNIFAITPNDIWLGLPDNTKWSDIKQALLFNRPQREFVDVNWSMGVRRSFGTGSNLQESLRLPVYAPSVDWPLIAAPKSVSKVILADDILYKVTSSPWLLDEE
jgi:hypothetical protein